MFGSGKRQPKPTEKAKDFFQSVKKVVKHKGGNEITLVSSSKAKRTLVAASSDSEENPNTSISSTQAGPTRSKRTRRAIVRSEDEEDSLHGDAEIIEVPAPKSQPTGPGADKGHNGSESESEVESPEEDSEAEMSMNFTCYITSY